VIAARSPSWRVVLWAALFAATVAVAIWLLCRDPTATRQVIAAAGRNSGARWLLIVLATAAFYLTDWVGWFAAGVLVRVLAWHIAFIPGAILLVFAVRRHGWNALSRLVWSER
jgi:hypothetical protein